MEISKRKLDWLSECDTTVSKQSHELTHIKGLKCRNMATAELFDTIFMFCKREKVSQLFCHNMYFFYLKKLKKEVNAKAGKSQCTH